MLSWRTIVREPLGAIALVVSTILVIIQSQYIYDKFRSRLTVSLYSGKISDSVKCSLSQLEIVNNTDNIIRDVRLIIARDWLAKRDNLQDFAFHYRGDAMLEKGKNKFIDRENIYVAYRPEGNVLIIQKLNPGEWLDLVVTYKPNTEAEKIRTGFSENSSDYFTPRIANVSSEDGKALVLHHRDSCLIEDYRPSNASWRFW